MNILVMHMIALYIRWLSSVIKSLFTTGVHIAIIGLSKFDSHIPQSVRLEI